MADRIGQLPYVLRDSYGENRSAQQRVARITSFANETKFLALPVVSWFERRTHPNTALLFKQRLEFVLGEAAACADLGRPELSGAPVEGGGASPGAMRAATLLVTCKLISAMLVDWAGDIDAETAAKQATSGEPHGPKGRREQQSEWLAEAMLLVCDHPEWTDKAVAAAVGRSPSTLSRSVQYHEAAKRARSRSARTRRGFIKRDSDTGLTDIDAYANERDSET